MEDINDDTPADCLYLKGLAIRHERRLGKWLPIMWHLALRGHAGAMIELADWFSMAAPTHLARQRQPSARPDYTDAHTNLATCAQPNTWH